MLFPNQKKKTSIAGLPCKWLLGASPEIASATNIKKRVTSRESSKSKLRFHGFAARAADLNHLMHTFFHSLPKNGEKSMVFPPKASWDHRPAHPTSGKTSLTTFFQVGYQLLAHGTNLSWQEEKEARFFGGSTAMLCQLPNGSKWLKKDAKHFVCLMKKRENTRSHVHISYIMYVLYI